MEYTLSLGTSKSRRSSVTVPTTTAVLLSLPVLFIRRTLTLHVQNYSNHQQQWLKLCCKTEFKQELGKKTRRDRSYNYFTYQSGNGQRWSVGLAHKQTLQDNLVELGISSSS